MQIVNLYTVQPSDADDTTLETVDLSRIDTQGSDAFDRVLAGDCSQEAKERLATFLAVQVLRDPAVVTTYNPKAQELLLSLLEVFDAEDYLGFCERWERLFPGAMITQKEYEHVKSLGLNGAEDELEKIILALDQKEGLPALPFTDVVRSTSGRDIVRERLLTSEWMIKVDPLGRFILGDTGVLSEKGELATLSVPLSPTVALFSHSH